jgi:hypothetical protein
MKFSTFLFKRVFFSVLKVGPNTFNALSLRRRWVVMSHSSADVAVLRAQWLSQRSKRRHRRRENQEIGMAGCPASN